MYSSRIVYDVLSYGVIPGVFKTETKRVCLDRIRGNVLMYGLPLP